MDVKIGSKLKATCTLWYCMGQCSDDKIRRGEIVTVDRIDPDGRLGFREHADRYGPWDASCFKEATAKDIAKWEEKHG